MSVPKTRWNLFDYLILGYAVSMVSILLIWGRPLSQYSDELLFYITCALLTIVLVRYLPEDKSKIFQFIRLMYPVFLFTLLYRMTGGMMFLLHDRFLDYQLTDFELSLFGMHPTLYIDKHLLNTWLNEIIMGCYFSYYFMIPLFVVVLYVRNEITLLKKGIAAICLMFFMSYILFFLYPIEGPRYFFAQTYQHTVDGPVFRQLVNLVMAKGAVRGGCMPSSHFGVALVIWLYVLEKYRRHAIWLGVIVFGLGMGTFWGRFHYVTDVIVGGLIGLISVIIVNRIDNYRTNMLYKSENIKG